MRHVTNNLAAEPKTEPARRGRGRPRKSDAMTGAQRQSAYRERLRAASINVTVTEIAQHPAGAHDARVRECEQLRGDLAQARRELDGLSRAAPTARVPTDVAGIFERLPRPDDGDSGERRLQLTMKGTRFFALERLAAHFSLSRHAVIEHLIDWADDTLTKSLYDDEAAFNRYIDRDRNKK
ncbi:hypothetical protein SAMN05414139_10778 [Burkholderia sp. D7]|nr:hypothetical protein SAMN05414139_10778 [Burkholderia sp. D7]